MDFLIAESTSYNLIRTRWLFGAALLAAAALGLLTLRWLLARAAANGQKGPAAALRGWWTEEIWLGGPFAAQARERLAQGWFTAVFFLFMLRWLLADILAASFSLRPLTDLLFWGIAAKLLVFTRYSAKQLLTAGAFCLPFLAAAAMGSSQMLLYQILFLICVKDVDLRRAFRWVLAAMAGIVAAVMLLAAAGLLPTISWGESSRARYTFGFTYPNSCGKNLLYLAFGWLLLRFERIRWWDWMGLGALFWLCNSIVDTRAPAISILVLLAAGLTARYLPGLWQAKPLRLLGAACPWAAAAASFGLALGYRPGTALWDKLNDFSSGRLELFKLAVERLRITPFGQVVKDEELYTLDNMYLNNFYALGLVGFFLYFGLLSWLLWRCWKQGWAAETVVFLGLAAYGMFESFCWESVCPAVFLFANVICQPAPGREVRISRDRPTGADAPAGRP